MVKVLRPAVEGVEEAAVFLSMGSAQVEKDQGMPRATAQGVAF